MQDYYCAPREKLILEVGRDEWVYNPRENEELNNIYHFYTWEDDGSPSPDDNDYETMKEFYDKFLHGSKRGSILDVKKALEENGYYYFPVSRNDWCGLYEISTENSYDPVIGFIFQKRDTLKEKCPILWKDQAAKELKRYNQFISQDVAFINTYKDGQIAGFKNCVYEKDEELSKYKGVKLLGCYCNIDECMADNPNIFTDTNDWKEMAPPKPKKRRTALEKIMDIGRQSN